jgi:hypothetical protein
MCGLDVHCYTLLVRNGGFACAFVVDEIIGKMVAQKVASGTYNLASEGFGEVLRLFDLNERADCAHPERIRSQVSRGLADSEAGIVIANDTAGYVAALVEHAAERVLDRIGESIGQLRLSVL